MKQAACFLGAIACAVTASIAGGPVDLPEAKGPAWIAVDCDAGQRLGTVIATHRADPLLAIAFSGTCVEDVEIRRDDVTIRGGGPEPTVVGGISVVTARRVSFSDFTVRESSSYGISVERGSSIELDYMVVEQHYASGVYLSQSGARLRDCQFLLNGFAGVDVENNSYAVLEGDTVSHGNIVGFLATTGSSLQAWSVGVPIEVSNNSVGLGADLSATMWLSRVDVSDGFAGAGAFSTASITAHDLTTTDTTIGIQVGESAGLDLHDSDLHLNAFGIISDGGHVQVMDSTVDGNSVVDVGLEFGAQATFNGTNDVGVISCDATVLSRGDVTCPASAVAQDMPRLQGGIQGLVHLLRPAGPGSRTEIDLDGVVAPGRPRRPVRPE